MEAPEGEGTYSTPQLGLDTALLNVPRVGQTAHALAQLAPGARPAGLPGLGSSTAPAVSQRP